MAQRKLGKIEVKRSKDVLTVRNQVILHVPAKKQLHAVIARRLVTTTRTASQLRQNIHTMRRKPSSERP